jgi:sugar phosphate permease
VNKSISFLKAWTVPRVFLYSLTFFFTKLAVQTILLWLPTFLSEELHFDNHKIANVSTIFDIGAICGSIGLGALSDKIYSKRSIVAMIAVISSAITSFVITFHY